MSTQREPRFTRAKAERLLDDCAGEPERLRILLAAAASPAAAGELVGEYAAVAAFRVAQLPPAPHRRSQMSKPTLVRSITTKLVATAAFAAAATGGVALAAASGSPSLPSTQAAVDGSDAPSAAVSTGSDVPTGSDLPTGSDVPGDPSSSESETAPDPTDSSEVDDPTSSDTPTPSLFGLCTAYQAGVANGHGKNMSNPAFSVLVSAAGGVDNVGTYCTDMVGPARTHPSHPGSPETSDPTDDPATSAPVTHGKAKTRTQHHHRTGAPAVRPGRP
jgi:hypothetical protein